MSEKKQFRYFYDTEANMFTFYKIPKLLITDEYFRGISNDAKILYGLMLDRMALSAKNGWLDEDNRVYIYFSIADAMEQLNVGKNKAINLMAELDSESGIGLIEKRNQGQGKPAIIYVKSFVRDEGQKFENQTSERNEPVSEVYDLNSKKFEKQTSRGVESKLLEVYISNNNNKYINNNINDTESNPIISIEARSLEVAEYSRLVRENLEIDSLISVNPLEAELYEGLYSLVLEVILEQNDTMVIAGSRRKTGLVRSKFLRLNAKHLQYVISCMKKNTTKIKNIKQYILAALFNAPSTISGYYQAEVNYDMPQYAQGGDKKTGKKEE